MSTSFASRTSLAVSGRSGRTRSLLRYVSSVRVRLGRRSFLSDVLIRELFLKVIIGSIVIKSRDSDTVRNAMLELNMAASLFEKAALIADRAKRSLVRHFIHPVIQTCVSLFISFC